jgi:hypothetical protein
MININAPARSLPVKKIRLLPAILCLFAAIAFTADVSLPQKHEARQMEGWSVRVDQRLLGGEQQAKGEKALRLLQSKLVAITTLVPEKPLKEL